MASGSFFALRRSLWSPLDENLGDDFVLPLRILRAGKRNVLDSRIVASTTMAAGSPREFLRMKTRIITRDFSALMASREILDPSHYGKVALGLWSHKLLRWLVPYFLVVLFFAALCVPTEVCRWLLYSQLAFYAAAIGGLAVRNPCGAPILRAPLSFCLVNLAALLGTRNYCLGRTRGRWHTQRRLPHGLASSSESSGASK